MIRAAPLLPLLLLLQGQATKPAPHVWEKRLAPGLLYRMEWDPSIPRVVNALRITLRSPSIHAMTELAGHTVFEDNPSKGRLTVSAMVKEDQALAGINGDFFPYTGDPLGVMVRDGELVSAPFFSKEDAAAHRAGFGWGAGSAMGFAKLKLTVQTPNDPPILVDGFDEACGSDRIVVDSPSAGLAIAKAPNAFVVLTTTNAKWSPGASIDAVVQSVGANLTSQAVTENAVVLVASGRMAPQLGVLRQGESVKISLDMSGFDFERYPNVIGGGPVVLRNGQVFVDYAEERFKPVFAQNRHPRTAIGRTKSGDLWLVTVDGRSKLSIGATLVELGTIMQDLGCVDAINLDGGNSTTMNLLGLTVNRPSDGIEREVANGILITGERPAATSEALYLTELPDGAGVGRSNQLFVVRGTVAGGDKIPNAEVVWSCSGPAWIDQGGGLHPLGVGMARVTAYVRGIAITNDYKVGA